MPRLRGAVRPARGRRRPVIAERQLRKTKVSAHREGSRPMPAKAVVSSDITDSASGDPCPSRRSCSLLAGLAVNY